MNMASELVDSRQAPSPQKSRFADLLKAVLLFYSASPWTQEQSTEFYRLTGLSEKRGVTTKSLCDSIRLALMEEGAW